MHILFISPLSLRDAYHHDALLCCFFSLNNIGKKMHGAVFMQLYRLNLLLAMSKIMFINEIMQCGDGIMIKIINKMARKHTWKSITKQ